VREGLAPVHIAREGEEGRPHRILQAAVGDHHVENRLGPVSDPGPDIERLQHPPRRCRDGIGALVPMGIAPERRIAHDHVDPAGERLLERQRQGQPGEPSARNDDARSLHPRCCAHRSFSHGIFGQVDSIRRWKMRVPKKLSGSGSYRWVSAIH
jgi:hypothetical protein